MSEQYRIHGDNIVECERLAKIVIDEVSPTIIKKHLISPSTIVIDMCFSYKNHYHTWSLELLPGFNKAGRSRWEDDIFDTLRSNGSFLDETPDAIITKVNGSIETILCAIEFCSALQAGNQAWQRSGRAYSTGRTGCPYIYIVEFVKYELDAKTRQRKALRFPNPAVPYSYINYTKKTGTFVAQVYTKSEEFNKDYDIILSSFNEDNFADKELSQFIVSKMASLDTSDIEKTIIEKNLNVVLFLSDKYNSLTNFTAKEWNDIYTNSNDIINYCVANSRFNFHKIITEKGAHGHSLELLNVVDNLSVGFTSKDLPIGIIPAEKRTLFANELKILYPSFHEGTLNKIAEQNKNLVLCIIKGFKPRGDDNRPDRGILPLATMLSSDNYEVLTFLYGPVLKRNYELLLCNPSLLASNNGLWKSILALSDFLILDVPIIGKHDSDATELINTTALKKSYLNTKPRVTNLTNKLFLGVPKQFHEDDVDTGIHFLFTSILSDCCFEGMCNPPGGDWSGFSIIINDNEYRWLSLPRVSTDVKGKRPDHIIEIFGVFSKPLLLSIESKEKSSTLEKEVGIGLKNYITSLMNYVPNAKRSIHNSDWVRASEYVSSNNFELISAAAYLSDEAQAPTEVYKYSKCDLLIIMNPESIGWSIKMIPYTNNASMLKKQIMNRVNAKNSVITIY